MGEKIACECKKIDLHGEFQKAASGCGREFELTDGDVERYLPRDESQTNQIISKDCQIPPLSSVIRYGPDYYVLKKGRVLREGFHRSLPPYKP